MIIKIDGADVRYEVMGEGKPVLILHGWGTSVEAMTSIWMFLKNKYKVYVLDFPGESGQSSVPPIPWGVPEYGEMVRKFIEKMDIKKVNVIGHSFGGRVIIYLASHYENLFDKIILTDAAGVKPKMTFYKFKRKLCFKVGKFMCKIFLPREKYEEKLAKYREKYSAPDYKALKTDVMRETFKKVIALDLTKNLKSITRPTLLIWGENDIDTPLYMAKIMEEQIPDARFSGFEGSNAFFVP